MSKGKNNRRQGRRRKQPKKNNVNPAEFWGQADKLPPDQTSTHVISDASAIVRSLGRPPLSGQQNAAEYYFVAVYDRAVALAGALATAGNLIDADTDADPRS